jgi:hypothetical protein
MVSPEESLYATIAREFIAAQREEYGLGEGGFYACDICECSHCCLGILKPA